MGGTACRLRLYRPPFLIFSASSAQSSRVGTCTLEAAKISLTRSVTGTKSWVTYFSKNSPLA